MERDGFYGAPAHRPEPTEPHAHRREIAPSAYPHVVVHVPDCFPRRRREWETSGDRGSERGLRGTKKHARNKTRARENTIHPESAASSLSLAYRARHEARLPIGLPILPPAPLFLALAFYTSPVLGRNRSLLDWTPFFQRPPGGGGGGKFPRHLIPTIFEKKGVGPKAKELFDDGASCSIKFVLERSL